ncbi:MAG TPA: hypothetical protein VFE51_17585 [Verrucomicrobiae bacterium]|nr:hypothetical protein [Verrucomicrobiae bacterium]
MTARLNRNAGVITGLQKNFEIPASNTYTTTLESEPQPYSSRQEPTP